MKPRPWVVLIALAMLMALTPSLLGRGSFSTYLALVGKEAAGGPSPTPIATATPQSGGVTILPGHYHYWRWPSATLLYFLGEVQNDTGQTVERIRFTVDFYQGEQLVGTRTFGLNSFGYLPTDTKSCFWLSFNRGGSNPLPEVWDSYRFRPLEYWTTDVPVVPLVTGNVQATPTTHWYRLEWTVYNSSEQQLEGITDSVALYDGAGKLVGCNRPYSFGIPFALLPNRSMDLDSYFEGQEQYLTVASHEIRAYGVPAGVLTPTPTRTPLPTTPTSSPTPVDTPSPTPTATPTPVAPVIANGQAINQGNCLFKLTTDYSDAHGNVSAGTAFHYSYSQGQTTVFNPDITGDGYVGTVSVYICLPLVPEGGKTVTVHLTNAAGVDSNLLEIVAPQP